VYEAIDGALRADGIRKGGQPFIRAAIRRHDDRPGEREHLVSIRRFENCDNTNTLRPYLRDLISIQSARSVM
jgi:hypothetical protein